MKNVFEELYFFAMGRVRQLFLTPALFLWIQQTACRRDPTLQLFILVSLPHFPLKLYLI